MLKKKKKWKQKFLISTRISNFQIQLAHPDSFNTPSILSDLHIEKFDNFQTSFSSQKKNFEGPISKYESFKNNYFGEEAPLRSDKQNSGESGGSVSSGIVPQDETSDFAFLSGASSAKFQILEDELPSGENFNPNKEVRISNVRSRNILRFLFAIGGASEKALSPTRPGQLLGQTQAREKSKRLGGDFPGLLNQISTLKVGPVMHRLRKILPFGPTVLRNRGSELSLPFQIFFVSLPCVLFFGISKSISYANGLQSSQHFLEIGFISNFPNSQTVLGLSSERSPENQLGQDSGAWSKGGKLAKLMNLSIQEIGPLYGNFHEKAELCEASRGGTSSLQNSFQLGLRPMEENLFRLPEYASKIFLIWALLYVWKGVRPQRRLSKDVRDLGFSRIVWPDKPSGGLRRFLQSSPGTHSGEFENTLSSQSFGAQKSLFSKLQGLQAFFPLFQTLLFSLELSRKGSRFQNTQLWNSAGEAGEAFNSVFQKIQPILGQSTSTNGYSPAKSGNLDFSPAFPKGYLFVGPPGTGKTLLAQAIAHEAKLPLLCVSSSEIQKQIEIGTQIGALRVRKLFEQARRMAPCILFFDEIDAIGKSRGGSGDTGTSGSSPHNFAEREEQNTGSSSIDFKLFTEFLIQMDSVPNPGKPGGFVVIGTTNYFNQLDSAFIRSGRFDRIVALNFPPQKVRIDILKSYLGQSLVSDSKTDASEFIPWKYFGYYTEGWSPADLARMVNEAALYNLREGASAPQSLGSKKRKVFSFQSLQIGFNRIQAHRSYLGKKN
jgi:hypothetical protein